MLETLKELTYAANMRLPEEGLVTLTWGNVSSIVGSPHPLIPV